MIELKGITWDHPRGYGPLAASEAIYTEQANVTVHWDKRSLKDFGDAPLLDLARDYNLIVLDHPHMGVAAEADCLLPLEELLPASALQSLAENSAGPSFRSYHYAGHQWALPIDAACQVAARRPDLTGADAPWPAKWEAVFALIPLLKKQGLQLGMALCPTDTLCSFLTLCAQLGDGPIEGRAELVEQAVGRRAIERLQQLRDAAHPDSLRWNPIRLFDAMSQADSQIAYAPLAFGYTNYARDGFAPKRLAFGPIPERSNALLGGAGIAISKGCQAASEAARYLLWLCDADFQTGPYVAHGGQPGNGAAWRDPAANRLTGGFLCDTKSTLEQAYMRPRNQGWPAFQEYLGERLHGFLKNHEMNPDKVLTELQERYETI